MPPRAYSQLFYSQLFYSQLLYSPPRRLDYSDVTAVVQLGAPPDRATYIHRLGRTGRAGAAGVGHLLLAESEASFLTCLGGLPLTRAPPLPPAAAALLEPRLRAARGALPASLAQEAYASLLGVCSEPGCLRRLRWSKEDAVRHTNAFAAGVLGLATPPPLDAAALQRMGLAGVRGVAAKTTSLSCFSVAGNAPRHKGRCALG